MAKWTQFWDMHSGGGQKLDWSQIFIEAPEDEARRVFYARFGRNPNNVTCGCCGADYSVSESDSLEEATAYHRGLRSIEGTYDKAEKRWKYGSEDRAHGYLEPGEPVPEGARLSRLSGGLYGKHREQYPEGMTVAQYEATSGVCFVRADSITNAERTSPKGSYRDFADISDD